MSFVNVYQFVRVLLSLLTFLERGDMILLVPDHCLSIFYTSSARYLLCKIKNVFDTMSIKDLVK